MNTRNNKLADPALLTADLAVNLTQSNSAQAMQVLRDEAEAIIRENALRYPQVPPETLSPEATQQMLYELRVQQIELEIQNEELRRAHLELEASQARYFELYDLAPVGYCSLSEHGLILEANLAAATLLDMSRSALVKQPISRFILKEDQDIYYLYRKQLLELVAAQSCELRMLKNDGTPFWSQLQAVAAQDAKGLPVLRLTLIDITGRKQAEEVLRIAAKAFEMQDSIMVTDARQVILRVNQGFSSLTGYQSKDVLGKTPLFLRSGRHDDSFYQALWASARQHGYWQGEIWERRKNGEVFPGWLTLTAVTDAQHVISHYVCTLKDITLQKQAEKVLFETQQSLEQQALATQQVTEDIRQESVELNTVLKVLLTHRKTDQSETKIALACAIKETILPFLKKLHGAKPNRDQARLLSILEHNILQLAQDYGRDACFSSLFQQLTPVEAQVASMIRQGLATKVIAATLNCSSGTVSIHRKHIRKKLGLDNKACNLRSYLQSLSE